MVLVRSLVRATLTFLSLYFLALFVLLIPSGVRIGQRLTIAGWAGSRYDWRGYWESVCYHLRELAGGNLLVKNPELPGHQWLDLKDLPAETGVTLLLILGSLVLSLVLGVLLGYLSTNLHASRVLQKGASGLTLFLSSLPDILVLLTVQLGLLFYNEWTGAQIPISGRPFSLLTWRHFIAPLTALALIPLPYWSKLVASALREAASQLYVRTAKAKGLPPVSVVWGHIGRNALPYVWSSLPVMFGLILSATPMAEHLLSMPGLGAQLVRARAGYRALFYLTPMLVLMSASFAVTTVATRWVNPVEGTDSEATPTAPRGMGWSGLSGALREFGAWLRDGLKAVPFWPRRILAALGSNGPLLTGTLIVTGLVAVAIFAHKLAPYSWTRVEITRFVPGDVLVPPFRPNPHNWLGSDGWGRDILSLLIWGCRYTVIFAMVVVPMRFLLAVPLGMLAARGGVMEGVVRSSAIAFSCLPSWLLPLALIPAVNNIFLRQFLISSAVGILLIALPGVPRLAEAIRLHARELWSRPYIEGAWAAGANPTRIVLRHLLPHLWPRLAVMAALEVPPVLGITTFLGYSRVFLGGVIVNTEAPVEVFPYMPEWGWMMGDAFRLLRVVSWWELTPLVALMITVSGVTLLAEGLRRQASSRHEGVEYTG